MKPTAMKHQLESLKFMKTRKAVFDMSDPGTGKTFVEIMDFAQQNKKDGKAMLVLCPKSLMKAAWANDVRKFAPHLKVSIAWAKDRKAALEASADVIILNHDGVKELLKYDGKKQFWSKFGRIVVDESTAFKHGTSARSKALAKIVKNFEWRRLMSGTPTSNGICDLWHQVYLLDNGKRLGGSFYGFRNSCCIAEGTGSQGQFLKWSDKPGIELMVGELIKDITIRHKFEDCVDIPENHRYSVAFELSAKHRMLYDELEASSMLILREGNVRAINKAGLLQKLLQCLSGAVYNEEGGHSKIASERYELVMDLVEERDHSIVFYLWDHQVDEMVELAKKRGYSYEVWNPDRPEIEQEYQAGRYKVLFAHPASAGHGLTLTKGTATIWPSPTYNLEHFIQGLKRVHRISQKEKTETIVVVAEGTRDEVVWERLQGKDMNMSALLSEME